MQHTCAEIDVSNPNQTTTVPTPNELTLLTLLPPPMGVKMQHTCAETDYSSPNQATILLMPKGLIIPACFFRRKQRQLGCPSG
jgi:hypothetical protein